MLSDITFAGNGNEEGPGQVRFPWSVNQPKEDFPDDPSDNWPMSGTHNTLKTTFKVQIFRYQTLYTVFLIGNKELATVCS